MRVTDLNWYDRGSDNNQNTKDRQGEITLVTYCQWYQLNQQQGHKESPST